VRLCLSRWAAECRTGLAVLDDAARRDTATTAGQDHGQRRCDYGLAA
jgi:hypothetical protein